MAVFKGGSPSEIAVDIWNNPHLIYCPPGEVRHAYLEDGNWSDELVTTFPFGGICGSIATGREDVVHVTIPGFVNKSGLQYAVRTNNAWHFEGLQWGGGAGSEIVVDSNGVPHIGYLRGTFGVTPELNTIRHAVRTETGWMIENIEELGPHGGDDYVGRYVDIGVNLPSQTHIAWYNDTCNCLKHAWLNGTQWTKEVVDSREFMVGIHPSVAVDMQGNLSIAYVVLNGPDDFWLKYGYVSKGSWVIEPLDPIKGVGLTPSLAIGNDGLARVVYEDKLNHTVKYAVRLNGTWSSEVVYQDVGLGVRWTSLALDSCDNPHVSFHVYTDSSVRYATKGECPPEPEEASVSLDIDPDTLNLKSKGRWITAYLSAENASVYDISVSSILLQDTLEPERWDYQDDTLMLKFNRQDLIAMLEVGESVEIELSGKWKDGTAFEAFDYIRVINPGKK